MKVITVNHLKLKKYSHELAKQILNSDFKPDLIIGIKTGGVFVSKPLHEKISEKFNTPYCELSLSRPLTNKKKKWQIYKLLKLLPYPFLNILRNIEVKLYESIKSKKYILNRQNDILIDDKTIVLIRKSKNILLVDDAIDSGATLLEMKNKLLSINKYANIKIAVLTLTHKSSYVNSDFFLFKRVLLRCPWANDYKDGGQI